MARDIKTPVEIYALGYCIASNAPTTSWHVELYGQSSDCLIWGLRSREQCKGIISTFLGDCLTPHFKECPTSILHDITCLYVTDTYYNLFNDYARYLAELIPSMCNLHTLAIGMYHDGYSTSLDQLSIAMCLICLFMVWTAVSHRMTTSSVHCPNSFIHPVGNLKL